MSCGGRLRTLKPKGSQDLGASRSGTLFLSHNNSLPFSGDHAKTSPEANVLQNHFFSPPELLLIILIASIPVTMIMTQHGPTGGLLSLCISYHNKLLQT